MQPERDGRLLTARVVPSSTPPGQDQVDAAPVREAEQRGEQRHAEGTEGRLARYTVASPEAPPPGPATVSSTSPMTGADSARAGRRLST